MSHDGQTLDYESPALTAELHALRVKIEHPMFNVQFEGRLPPALLEISDCRLIPIWNHAVIRGILVIVEIAILMTLTPHLQGKEQ